MRLTGSLFYPRMWINMRGRSWYRHRKKSILEDSNFNRIIASGYNVQDANEFVKPFSPLYNNYEELPDLKPRFPVPPKNNSDHPDWHDEACKVFNNSSFPIEGVQQALAFCKGVEVTTGLPEDILERMRSTEFSQNENKMAERIVQQAFLWDAALEQLPVVKEKDWLWYSPLREFGIPTKRSNEILANNFIRLIEGKADLSIPLSRMLTPQEQMRVNLKRHNSLVQFRLDAITHLVSKNPIKPKLSKQGVEDANQLPLANITPFISTANMEEENVYKKADHFVVGPESKFPHIHTSIFSHHIPGSYTHLHPRWNDDRFTGATIMYNFATACLMAKRKFGNNFNKVLPEPITTQVIHSTGKDFQFSVLQLNTLDLEDTTPTSVKNNVWVTDIVSLYSQIKNEYGKETFEGYNPEVLNIINAMYLS